MEVCGIVVEYNPFHKGHLYHINETKKITNCDVLIGVMSGSFVQRGDFACCTSAERAKIAINNGVDILVELPYPFTLQSADKFAIGAINILKALQVSSICFGSESNNLLKLYAELENSNELIAGLPKNQSLSSINKHDNSNDILGLSYLRAISNSDIKVYSIKRTNSYLDTNINEVSSASAIREAYKKGIDISEQTPLYSSFIDISLADFYPLIRHLLLTLNPQYLNNILLMSEGIENLLIKNARDNDNFETFLNKSTSKKYTTSRIRRTLCHLLLSTTKDDQEALEGLNMIRLLGINKKGQAYIKQNHLKLTTSFSKLPPIYKTYLNKVMFLTNDKSQLHLPYVKKD